MSTTQNPFSKLTGSTDSPSGANDRMTGGPFDPNRLHEPPAVPVGQDPVSVKLAAEVAAINQLIDAQAATAAATQADLVALENTTAIYDVAGYAKIIALQSAVQQARLAILKLEELRQRWVDWKPNAEQQGIDKVPFPVLAG